MKQIWKFPIDNPSVIKIILPAGSEVLTVQMQNNTPCIWILVDVNNLKQEEEKEFRLFETGVNIDNSESLKYINTFQMNNADLVLHLVFHLFEKIK